MPASTLVKSDVVTYPALFRRVKETLLDGQRRIEAERVRTYWETGRLIQQHILQNKKRNEYGAEVFARLADDLDCDKSTLQRCVQFFKAYPNFSIDGARHQLSWMHYRKLITIPNKTERVKFEALTLNGNLSSRELAARIKASRGNDKHTAVSIRQTNGDGATQERLTSNVLRLTSLRGQLYTYQLINPKAVASDSGLGLAIDLGFSTVHNIDKKLVANLKAGDIVESRATGDGAYCFAKSGRTSKDLYTYQAYVERVIDGDTLKVTIDLGFDTWVRQTLRLRAIDCPELGTKDGDQAKAYVQSLIKESDRIVIRSSRDDKYGRYLADVYLPQGEDKDIYLNNLLLGRRFAEAVK